jgi:DNA polymerase-3 subunit beta
MKLETTASILTKALRQMTAAIGSRNTIPILGTVLIDGNAVRGTDMDVELSISIPATKAGGSIAIDHRSLFALVRNIPGDDTVTVEGGKEGATVSFSSGRYDLPALPASDWPKLVVENTIPAAADGDGLKKALSFTSPFISIEETRYYLNGVCLDGDVAVATDGHRLGCHPAGDFRAFDRPIIPRKSVGLLTSLPAAKTIEFSTSKPAASFSFDGATLKTKLIDGTFPDWRRVVPRAEPASRLTLDSIQFGRVVRRMAALLKGREAYAGCATLVWNGDGRIALVGKRGGGEVAAREYVSGATVEGAPGVASYNAGYVGSLLNAIRSKTVTVSIIDGGHASLWRGDSEAFCLLMPMRGGDDAFAFATLSEWAHVSAIGRAA